MASPYPLVGLETEPDGYPVPQVLCESLVQLFKGGLGLTLNQLPRFLFVDRVSTFNAELWSSVHLYYTDGSRKSFFLGDGQVVGYVRSVMVSLYRLTHPCELCLNELLLSIDKNS